LTARQITFHALFKIIHRSDYINEGQRHNFRRSTTFIHTKISFLSILWGFSRVSTQNRAIRFAETASLGCL
jgi:hypothetical protein